MNCMHQYIPQHIISNIYIYIYIYKRSHSSLPLSSCTPLPSVLLTCQVPEEVATSLLAFLGTPPPLFSFRPTLFLHCIVAIIIPYSLSSLPTDSFRFKGGKKGKRHVHTRTCKYENSKSEHV